MTPHTSAARVRRVMREALTRFLAQLERRPESRADAWWWSTFRASLVAAGATPADLETLATVFVCWAVERTDPGSAQRHEQVQLIGTHLAATPMVVRISTDESSMSIEFPHRARVH